MIFQSFKKADTSRPLLILFVGKILYALTAVFGENQWMDWSFQGFTTHDLSHIWWLSFFIATLMQMVIMWRLDEWMYSIGCYQTARHTALWFAFLCLHAHPALSHASIHLCLILFMMLFLEGNFTLGKKEIKLSYTANHGITLGIISWVNILIALPMLIGYGPRLQDSRDVFRHSIVLLFFWGLVWGAMEWIPYATDWSSSWNDVLDNGLPLAHLFEEKAQLITPSLLVMVGTIMLATIALVLLEVPKQRLRHIMRNFILVYLVLGLLIALNFEQEFSLILLGVPLGVVLLVRGFEQLHNRWLFELISILCFGTILLDLLGVFVLFDL